MDESPTPILLVDDDTELCAMLTEYLGGEGFAVTAVHDGTAVGERLRGGDWQAVILDVMLPGKDGFEVLRELRQVTQAPVLMLTARGEDTDTVVGLELGADDYLAKPFNPRVLLARLRALRRRSGPEPSPGVLEAGDLCLDPNRREVRLAGQPVGLTGAELDLLTMLMRHPGQLISKEALAREGLGRDLLPGDRRVDNHVSQLRRKLGPLPDGGTRILARRGAGYQLVLP